MKSWWDFVGYGTALSFLLIAVVGIARALCDDWRDVRLLLRFLLLFAALVAASTTAIYSFSQSQ